MVGCGQKSQRPRPKSGPHLKYWPNLKLQPPGAAQDWPRRFHSLRIMEHSAAFEKHLAPHRAGEPLLAPLRKTPVDPVVNDREIPRAACSAFIRFLGMRTTMKKSTWVGALVVLGALGALGVAAELKSGLEPGKYVDAFDVVKCAGSEDDDVKIGDKLCYRCKYGSRPMVMVFARKADEQLGELVKQLDAKVADASDSKLAAFVNLLGESRDDLETAAKEFGETTGTKNVPIVVPVEYENGPENYGINPEVGVTVILANKGKVVANHALDGEDLDEKAVEAILDDVSKMIN